MSGRKSRGDWVTGSSRNRSLNIETGRSGSVYNLSAGVEVLAVDTNGMMPEIGHWELLDGGELLVFIKVENTE